MAKHHNDLQVRCDMVQFIDDEDILKDIFLNDDVARVCICAMSQIKDTDFLTDECLNNPNSHLRLAILNRIFDESLLSENELSQLLEKILLNDPDSYVLKTALEKAKSAPCIFNNWANFYRGEFVSNTILNANALEKLLK